MIEKIQLFAELLYVLVRKELKVRYKNSLLGYFWALLNPFAFAFVYYVAFKVIMRVQMPNYSIFLIAGMFPWVWMVNSLVQATATYKNNASLVKKVNLNKAILPISNVAHEMVHFLLTLPVLAIFIIYTGGSWYLSWFWQIPLLLILQFLLIYPVALTLALLNAFVHDIEYLIGIFLSLLFFVTPIVYPISMVPAKYLIYFEFNPIFTLISNWRLVFLQGQLDAIALLYSLLVAIPLSLFAIWFYKKTSPKLGELL